MSIPGLKTHFRLSAMAAACVVAAGCASVQPVSLSPTEVSTQLQYDSERIRAFAEPISGALTLDEALARALKYNLERRTRMMEEALALGQLDVGKFDMLPKLMAQAGYNKRDRARFTYSSQFPDETPNLRNPASTSADASHSTSDLGLTWSMLDLGLGYSNAKQQADRFLIAGEKRRKAMHLLMQDVRTAYWRAASAQLLKADVMKIIMLADEALQDSRTAGAERVRNPLEPLRYQRQLLENLRLLENINQELASAQIDLASLINAPLSTPIQISDTDLKNITDDIALVPVEKLEEIALHNNPDLREQRYNSRISREETRRTMLRMFPNLSFNYGAKYDTDRYLMSNNWNEVGVQLSFNLLNLLTASSQMKLSEAGVELADQRRMATQSAVLTQVHLSRLQVINARSQYDRADAIYETDKRISEVMRNRQKVQAQSKLDLVSTETSSVLSLLRRYQALAQVQVAENRMLATLGMEPTIGNTQELGLRELTAQITQSKAPWAQWVERKTEDDASEKKATLPNVAPELLTPLPKPNTTVSPSPAQADNGKDGEDKVAAKNSANSAQTQTQTQTQAAPVLDQATQEELQLAVSAWADAWSRQDMAAYLDAYSGQFVPDKNLTRDEWKSQRKARITGRKSIQVTVGKLEFENLNQDIQVTFNQIYKSGKTHTNQQKRLVFSKQDGQWKIAREEVVPK